MLFRAIDGGGMWQQLRMPAGGPVAFASQRTGWQVFDGPPGARPSEPFYVRTDGGQAWQAETVVPSAVYRPDQATFMMRRAASRRPRQSFSWWLAGGALSV
ncbi:MAG TPA: hypothetical protein VIV12_27530 [Streptosporangiaceae bacterium]